MFDDFDYVYYFKIVFLLIIYEVIEIIYFLKRCYLIFFFKFKVDNLKFSWYYKILVFIYWFFR